MTPIPSPPPVPFTDVAEAVVQRKLHARSARVSHICTISCGPRLLDASYLLHLFIVGILHALVDIGCWLSSWFSECPPFGASTPSALFLLMVLSNFMPGGVSTSSTIPLRGFLPSNSVGRWYLELGCPSKGVTVSFKEDRRVR